MSNRYVRRFSKAPCGFCYGCTRGLVCNNPSLINSIESEEKETRARKPAFRRKECGSLDTVHTLESYATESEATADNSESMLTMNEFASILGYV